MRAPVKYQCLTSSLVGALANPATWGHETYRTMKQGQHNHLLRIMSLLSGSRPPLNVLNIKTLTIRQHNGSGWIGSELSRRGYIEPSMGSMCWFL